MAEKPFRRKVVDELSFKERKDRQKKVKKKMEGKRERRRRGKSNYRDDIYDDWHGFLRDIS